MPQTTRRIVQAPHYKHDHRQNDLYAIIGDVNGVLRETIPGFGISGPMDIMRAMATYYRVSAKDVVCFNCIFPLASLPLSFDFAYPDM